MQQLANGTLLQGGKYRIEEKIGQGGFGITYRACQPLMLERKVCIKEFCLKQHFTRESTTSAITYPNDTARKDAEIYQQKFIKEAQTLYSMHHPNIMEIYDIFEENNTAYYVMEYIEGESLKDMLEHRGCIPEAEAIGYIRKVAEALKYIHSRNINHFDVKPGNILVRSRDDEIILIDFGTAKHYDSKTGSATTMSSGLLSPGYAPIEQYKQGGVSLFTPETDVYALGATFYKLLTDNTPPEPTEIIINGLPDLPSSVSKATKDLIRWSMQLNKADRPHSCDEFLNALPSNVDPDFNSRISESNDVSYEATISINSGETEYFDKSKVSNEETILVGSSIGTTSQTDFIEATYAIEAKYKNDPVGTAAKAQTGDNDAAVAYGMMALRGQGITQDLEVAYSWFELAESNGDARAEKIIDQWDSLRNKYYKKEKTPKELSHNNGKSSSLAVLCIIGVISLIGVFCFFNNYSLDKVSSQPISSITYTVNGVSFEMMKVEGGKFIMGATSKMKEPWYDEKPIHEVTLTNNYYIGKTEVTMALWKAVMGKTPQNYEASKPVVYVNWNDCQNFCKKLNSMTGQNFRLPTEAEWEFAAKGGNNSKDYLYSGSNKLDNVAWYENNSEGKTHDVATKQPNELGVYDMSGNVLEWCNDIYGYYRTSPQTNPSGLCDGYKRVIRGGNYINNNWSCRTSCRYYSDNSSDSRFLGLGFRLALSE